MRMKPVLVATEMAPPTVELLQKVKAEASKRRRRGASASRSSVPAGLAVGLQAGTALGPDEGAVRCPCRKIEAGAGAPGHVLLPVPGSGARPGAARDPL